MSHDWFNLGKPDNPIVAATCCTIFKRCASGMTVEVDKLSVDSEQLNTRIVTRTCYDDLHLNETLRVSPDECTCEGAGISHETKSSSTNMSLGTPLPMCSGTRQSDPGEVGGARAITCAGPNHLTWGPVGLPRQQQC